MERKQVSTGGGISLSFVVALVWVLYQLFKVGASFWPTLGWGLLIWIGLSVALNVLVVLLLVVIAIIANKS